ncbi:MAG: cell division protein [Candidatus Babeliales bacterium]
MIQLSKSKMSIIFFIFSGSYAVVFINLVYLQVFQHSFFTQLGQKQYHVTITSYPPRGLILDRNGKFLAINKDSLAAFILPKQLEDKKQLELFLAKYFPAAKERLQTHPQAHFLYVQRRLTPEQIELIEKNNIVDIKFLNEPNRYYPCRAASTLIGLTDIDNRGLFGLELQFDEELSGSSTTVNLEKDARSGHFYFSKELMNSGQQSKPLITTIDSDLQFLVQDALAQTMEKYAAKEGAAIIIDPHTGEILAMTNLPSFDPNNFYGDLSHTKNTCITECYELGSVFKICSALAAIDEKVVTPEELIDCKNTKTTYIDGRKINTVIPLSIVPFEDVIAYSNNIGIAQVAQRVGTKLYDHYAQLGFGKKTGIPFPGENKGFINPPKNWSKQSIISLSYGYEVSANLLQLARAFCVIANGGYWIDPILIKSQTNQKKQKIYGDDTITIIQQLLEKTTASGTAKKAYIKGYRIMCKTGTAELLESGHYNRDRNIFTCSGIIQKDNYQRVIVVFIKEVAQKDLYASGVAAPLFEQIAEKVLIKDRII